MKYGLWIGAGLTVACSVGIAAWYQQEKKRTGQKNLSEQCRLELERFGDIFEGLYEKTAQWLQKENDTEAAEELCFSWEARLENEEQTVGLKKAWEQLAGCGASMRIKKWFDFLLAIGVRKCEEKEVSVDRAILQRYDLPEDGADYMGKRMQIKDPCWMIGEKILEKGTLM